MENIQMQGNGKRVLLAVFAHPDDESFGTGGTLAYYAEQGVEVHLVCATKGEAGQMDADCLDGFKTIAERRVSELRCAAGILGLSGVHLLNYRDSGMPGSADNQHPQALINAPLDEVAQQIAHYIRMLHPQVVITFDPIGGYKHPDHIHIHKATVQAFQLAADPSFYYDIPPYQAQKLYYHVMPKRMMKVGVRLMQLFGRDPRRFGRNGDIDLLELVEAGDFPVHAEINTRSVEEKRAAAANCHASQLGGMPRRGPVGWLLQRFGGQEQFMRAAPPVQGKLREKDLFEGIIV